MILKRGAVFSQGAEICGMIARTDWKLYDMSALPDGEPEWDLINVLSPATELVCAHNYFFIPTPANGESLRDAYARKMGVGPSMRIVDPNHDRWLSLEVHSPYRIAVFSRLLVDEECIALVTPEDAGPHSDFVAIAFEHAVDVFKNFYGIVETLDDYHHGRQRPLSTFPAAA